MDDILTPRQTLLVYIAEVYKKECGIVLTIESRKFSEEVIVVIRYENIKDLINYINEEMNQDLVDRSNTNRIAKYAILNQKQ